MLEICYDKVEPPTEADHLVEGSDRYADMNCKSMKPLSVSLPRMKPPMTCVIPGLGDLFASKKPTLLVDLSKVRLSPSIRTSWSEKEGRWK